MMNWWWRVGVGRGAMALAEGGEWAIEVVFLPGFGFGVL